LTAEPAPAMTIKGPSLCRTGLRWASFNSSKYDMDTFKMEKVKLANNWSSKKCSLQYF